MNETDIKIEDADLQIKEESEIKTEIEDSTAIGFELPIIFTTSLDSGSENCKLDDKRLLEVTMKKSNKLRKGKKKGKRIKIKNEPKDIIKTIVCPQCPLKFDRPSHLEIHLRVHSGERPFACTEEGCGRVFSVKARYNAHVKLRHAGDRSHVCEFCDRAFVTAHQLEEHSNLHLAQKPHECPHCSKKFSLRATMTMHIQKHHTKSLTCNQCDRKFNRRQYLLDHINVQHKGLQSKYKCSVCGSEFGAKHSLQRHSKVHEASCLICEFCERPFANRENLLPHLKAIHCDKPEPYECCFCEAAFARKHLLEEHESHDHRDIICVCSNCQAKFDKISDYRQHARAHPKWLFSYKCRVCGQECANREKIVEHINDHYGIQAFACTICDKKFTYKHLLVNHLRSHPETSRSKTCDVCGKSCRHNAELIVHKRLHSGERPYKCEKCPQTFRAERSLKHHAHVHTDEKSVTCDECGKTFKLKSSLVRHKWTHREVQLHPCQYCPKSFSKRHKWVIHTRIHTGEKPFACGTCGMKFKCKESRSIHEWTHKGGKKPFNCSVCRKGFMRKAFLKKHDCPGPSSAAEDEEDDLAVVEKKVVPETIFSNAIENMVELTETPVPVGPKKEAEYEPMIEQPGFQSDSDQYFNGDPQEPPQKFEIETTPPTRLPQSETADDENFFCDEAACQIMFPNLQTLATHNQTLHGMFQHVCTICLRNFPNAAKFDKHFWLEHLVDNRKSDICSLRCVLCSKIFRTQKEVQRHVNVVHKAKVELQFFECHHCGQRYSTKIELRKHVNRDHRTSKYKAEFKCKECGKQCRYRAELIVHERKHSGEKPYECPVCHQFFFAQRYLNKHASVHSEEKAFTCDVCGKVFKLNSSLIRHKWMHAAKKPHPCAYCDKSFAKRDLWVKHTRIHTGEKPFECEKCGLRFRDKDGLKNHQWTHENGKKPYNCEVCKKGFMRKAFLSRHICGGPEWEAEKLAAPTELSQPDCVMGN